MFKLLISLCFIVLINGILCLECLNNCNENDFKEGIKFIFYPRFTTDVSKSFDLKDLKNIPNENEFSRKKITIIYINGYTQTITEPLTLNVLNSYLRTGIYNVIQLNWQDFSKKEIPRDTAIVYMKQIGKLVASEMDALIKESDVLPEKIHLAGHSLGAQMTGVIGRNTNEKLGVLIGLDPSLPGFRENEPHLTSSDGNYVICLHTDAGYKGTDFTDFSVNYYANNGTRIQPGCPKTFEKASDESCNHNRAVELWAEIISEPKTFLARKCESYEELQAKKCQWNHITTISPLAQNVFGKYYFYTNEQSPFGLFGFDKVGVVFSNMAVNWKNMKNNEKKSGYVFSYSNFGRF